ncbi:hypothetical protein [Priestia koreensis]|uniref:Uncharacterized protein n=1 Tax=Priestia koreensis TaxID=284581 RepID=A0A0M0LI53_9BACI|nr:hypothetical protein [Priestia koreensis]KOO50656.1 hypothetical protein AMD01_02610 [Priestia koreensis]
MNYEQLLSAYRTLWSSRALPTLETAEFTLKEAIQKELGDEMTHPRVRKPLHMKYHFALTRILESSLPEGDQLALIRLHHTLYEELLHR